MDGTIANCKKKLPTEMTAKIAAQSFWVGEVEYELRRLKRQNFKFHADEDIEKAMNVIKEQRRESLYPHMTVV